MYDVLFVDNDLETAKEYAEQVSRFSKLKTLVLSNPAEAVDAVKRYPIAIVVLDQKMPEMTGTALFAELRRCSPFLRGIMLSGEADQNEIGDAINLGYEKYLHKSDFRKLPGLVLNEFSRYQTEFSRAVEFQPVLLTKVRHYLGLGGTTEFWLEGLTIEQNNLIPADAWNLIDTINSGEKKRITEKYELSKELRFEELIETKLSADIGVAIKAAAKIKGQLSSSISTKLKSSQVLTHRTSREVQTDVTLPAEPSNPKSLYVRSRAFFGRLLFAEFGAT